jgi:rod shape-determining protein MreD
MKVFSKFLHFFLIIICLLLQIALFEYLKMYYISFDLIMVIIIAVALFDGTLSGALYGFAAGMILDLMVGNIAGISAFIYAVDAFIVNRLITAGFKPTWLTYSFLVFLMTEINILLLNLILYLFNFSIDWSAISLELLVRPACNIVLMFIIFPLIRMSSGRSESKEIEFGLKYKDEI